VQSTAKVFARLRALARGRSACRILRHAAFPRRELMRSALKYGSLFSLDRSTSPAARRGGRLVRACDPDPALLGADTVHCCGEACLPPVPPAWRAAAGGERARRLPTSRWRRSLYFETHAAPKFGSGGVVWGERSSVPLRCRARSHPATADRSPHLCFWCWVPGGGHWTSQCDFAWRGRQGPRRSRC
jgi:hypothetical protein